jgi:hypothetical protein
MDAEDTAMDGLAMLRTACWIFLLAAAGGLVMAGIRLAADRNPPVWLAYAHGLLAGAGLTLVLYALLATRLDASVTGPALLLLAAAAGGSVLNLGFHWRQRPLPKGLMFGHILLAVAGLVWLMTVVF